MFLKGRHWADLISWSVAARSFQDCHILILFLLCRGCRVRWRLLSLITNFYCIVWFINFLVLTIMVTTLDEIISSFSLKCNSPRRSLHTDTTVPTTTRVSVFLAWCGYVLVVYDGFGLAGLAISLLGASDGGTLIRGGWCRFKTDRNDWSIR